MIRDPRIDPRAGDVVAFDGPPFPGGPPVGQYRVLAADNVSVTYTNPEGDVLTDTLPEWRVASGMCAWVVVTRDARLASRDRLVDLLEGVGAVRDDANAITEPALRAAVEAFTLACSTFRRALGAALRQPRPATDADALAEALADTHTALEAGQAGALRRTT